MTKSKHEEIMCVPAHVIDSLTGGLEGFISSKQIDGGETRVGQTIRDLAQYHVRNETLESNTDLKQVIPYIILRDGNRRIFTATRTSGGGEGRLHGKSLIGFGGHTRKEDVEGFTMPQWLDREFREELLLDSQCTLPKPLFYGLINDNSNPVGRVHVGLVYIFDLVEPWVAIREIDKLSSWGWYPPKHILHSGRELENWTSLVLNYMVTD